MFHGDYGNDDTLSPAVEVNSSNSIHFSLVLIEDNTIIQCNITESKFSPVRGFASKSLEPWRPGFPHNRNQALRKKSSTDFAQEINDIPKVSKFLDNPKV